MLSVAIPSLSTMLSVANYYAISRLNSKFHFIYEGFLNRKRFKTYVNKRLKREKTLF
jgi:hypothetical protein